MIYFTLILVKNNVLLVFLVATWYFRVLASIEPHVIFMNCDDINKTCPVRPQKFCNYDKYTRYFLNIYEHRFCSTDPTIRGTQQKPREIARFNITEDIWKLFADELDGRIRNIEAIPNSYDLFAKTVWEVSLANNITRGTRSIFKIGLDPITLEPNVVIKKETGADLSGSTTITKATADQVADLLVSNGEALHKLPEFPKGNLEPTTNISEPVTFNEIIRAIAALRNKSSPGFDDISIQQLKHMGPVAISWLVSLFNACIEVGEIPKIWKMAKTVAILKPGRPESDPKSYRPISCLCSVFKVFERLLLNRLKVAIEPKLIPEQYASRHSKRYTNTILDLAQYIEDGYKAKKITSIVIVDPSAAYESVNVDRLLAKIPTMINDISFINLVSKMLHKRRFHLYLNHDTSSWRYQINGLTQGSVLGPMLFNIYTNDIPRSENIHKFIYVDDIAVAMQTYSVIEAEDKFKHYLDILEKWYFDNALRPNPLKTKSGVFHQGQDNLKLNITWHGVSISHSDCPMFLGACIDKELEFRNKLKTKKL